MSMDAMPKRNQHAPEPDHTNEGEPTASGTGPTPLGPGGDIGAKITNDQRAAVFNPTSAAYKAAADNRSNQLNPQHPAYRSSRGRK